MFIYLFIYLNIFIQDIKYNSARLLYVVLLYNKTMVELGYLGIKWESSLDVSGLISLEPLEGMNFLYTDNYAIWLEPFVRVISGFLNLGRFTCNKL